MESTTGFIAMVCILWYNLVIQLFQDHALCLCVCSAQPVYLGACICEVSIQNMWSTLKWHYAECKEVHKYKCPWIASPVMNCDLVFGCVAPILFKHIVTKFVKLNWLK